MNHAQTLIENYAVADETQRLSMFLSHRDLRDAFMEIELAELNNQSKTASTNIRSRQRNRWLRCCWPWQTA